MLPSACRDRGEAANPAPYAVELKASVAPFDTVVVVAPFDGTVVATLAAPDSVVAKGDRIATLANPSIDRDVAAAHTAVTAAEQRMRQYTTPAARANVDSTGSESRAAAILRERQQRLERLRSLLASGDVTSAEVRAAEAEVAAAERDLAADKERAAARSTISPEARGVLQAELDRARSDLSAAEQRKSQLEIKAPISGAVRFSVTSGATVLARNPVATIVNTAEVRVEAPIAAELVRFVKPGREVELTLMSIPPKHLRLPIARVTPANAAGGATLIVSVPDPGRTLQPGTPATVRIK